MKLWTEENEAIVRKHWETASLKQIANEININQLNLLDNGAKNALLAGLGSVAWKAYELGLCSENGRKKAIRKARKRKPIDNNIKKRVLKRDNYKCLNCGSEKNIQIDHIVPVRLGGTSSYDNLQTLCKTCNRIKGGYLVCDYRYGQIKEYPLRETLLNLPASERLLATNNDD